MDDTARLVSELHDKLAELDGKVAAYQRDLLAEFHRHMDECLEKYPDHVSSEVSRVIAESMSAGRYPALSPGSRGVPDSPAIDRSAWDGRRSPPPFLRHTSGTPKESLRSPHAREKEFQGLFTPNYLPLLERDDRAHRSPPTSPPPASGGQPLSIENVQKVETSAQSIAGSGESRPGPTRRLTNLSTSSVESAGSDPKVRRSALRRSSSSNKGSSPRRVRFEFEGEEVFPASSPQASATTLALAGGAESQPQAEPTASIAPQDESTAFVGTSLLDVEGEEDALPRPRKVSSTQALQALTRSPLEEGTTWTVVNPDPEEAVQVNGQQHPEIADMTPTKVDSQATIRPADVLEGNPLPGPPIEELAISDDDNGYGDEENASDQEFLSMRPKKKTPSPAKSPSSSPPTQAAAASPITATEENGHQDVDEDHDPLFDFDDDGGRPASQTEQRARKYLSRLDDEEDQEQQPPPGRLRGGNREAAGESSTGIPPPVSSSAALFGHSIGSYMGKPVTATPIKDPKLYEEIASMQDVQFFVGSIVDGPADLGSYRAGRGVARNYVGTPRSFTERLALEEEMERRKAAGKGVDEGGDA
ncbi:68008ef2-56ff-4017-b34c-52fc4de68862 [Thermothielavioides terrestris]|uniref:Uncharacterized protein n=2 Tax=Thermothielavioides terrestris TaxID=2587410 RepID=G2RAB7_THETT|nr:uncharacterized protein THITE_2118579 [Thermothielavioides terrestris NRRL 8126]AEO68849.1 hypothetical protein THITE_2118579 [Thermothielavioides terrestris NRRL 8126]SPQ22883.1 68008ef2-56ff-4017-b34c-52fc4de68862 [Thermothielavioides terrestris]